MKKVSIQIQTVLYNNELNALIRSLDSISRAIEINKASDGITIEKAKVCYGDSSASPLLSPETLTEFKNKYCADFELSYTFFNKNMGTARGHNQLGAECKSDYILIMNPDVILAPDVISELLRPFCDESDRVGLVEARQTPIEHPKEYNTETGETSWATTACALFPSNIFFEVNGFDADSFFMYCDDLDFSWRIRLQGYKIIYQPSAIVFHDKRLTEDGEWMPTNAERYYSAESALLMAYKWSNPSRVRHLISYFTKSKDEILTKAANEFLRRKKEGLLPKQLDSGHKVATFVGDNYTRHRFAL